ncbi:hypothetical protein [Streptomyces sp. NPDC091268]|uniref:hypothetical protein n=1 Tax=Streptomyces sp. NPDC091268 TaxID=3365979 RepID=UPI003821AEC9
MAALSTIVVVLCAWCAASVLTAALYSALRSRQIRRHRMAVTAAPGTPPVPGGMGACRWGAGLR